MARMHTTMPYSINIMDTGNKQAIIWCDTDTHQMFPFERAEGNCILSIGVQSLIQRSLSLLMACGIKEITIFAHFTPAFLNEVRQYPCHCIEKTSDGFAQIASVMHKDTILSLIHI